MAIGNSGKPVHPHASGEHHTPIGQLFPCHGSSPREWGTPSKHPVDVCLPRFIPTRVGNTPHRKRSRRDKPVHPHASGEHCASPRAARMWRGSSPREWGTRDAGGTGRNLHRFIPTRVGNTGKRKFFGGDMSVHPHASGEHDPRGIAGRGKIGSSPREWGTLFTPMISSIGDRFIPTRVGNTPAVSSDATRISVHPHASGEHADEGKAHAWDAGSSPREWGTPAGGHGRCRCARFIPTRVGNTFIP